MNYYFPRQSLWVLLLVCNGDYAHSESIKHMMHHALTQLRNYVRLLIILIEETSE